MPDAPEEGVLRFQGPGYEPGQPGFPPLGLCYRVGQGFDPYFDEYHPDLGSCG